MKKLMNFKGKTLRVKDLWKYLNTFIKGIIAINNIRLTNNLQYFHTINNLVQQLKKFH